MTESLITKHLDLWTSAIEVKSTAGRGNRNKFDLYGIKKLRELILGLGLSGKLTDTNQQLAQDIAVQIQDSLKKYQLLENRKLREYKKTNAVLKEYKIPTGWCWYQVAQLCDLQTGATPSTQNPEFYGGDINWLVSGDINKYFIEDCEQTITKKGLDNSNCKILKPNTVMIALNGQGKTRATVALLKIEAACNQSLVGITPFSLNILDPMYLFYALKYRYFEIRDITGQNQRRGLNMGLVGQLSIPLAPIDEQIQIVKKIDELMILCDQLEQQTLTSMETHTTLVEILLTTLTASADADELAQNWNRISEYFDTLFTTEQSIDLLKQTILQLAVMGKLVPQDPTDEPASVLLEKIAAEKAQLIKDKKIKKEKPLPAISDDEKPFELPQGWEFAYLQDLCELITDGTHQTPTYSITGRPFVSAQCVKPFIFMPEKCRHVSEVDYQEYIKNRKPVYRDILLSRVGAGIGEAALIDINLDFAIYVSTALLKVFKVNMLPEYIVVWLNSPTGRIFSSKNTYGKGVSQGNLNLSLIRTFVISIPPVNEQKLIVSRVDNLMHLCANLNNKIQSANQQQLYLTDAIVEDALM